MGFRVLLIAIEGKAPAEIRRQLDVAPTDEFCDVPDSPVNGAAIPNGGYVLYINDRISPDDALFETLSRGASLLACYANETTMCSFAAMWANGEEQWSVLHDCDDGLNHLLTTGILPEQLGTIREQQLAKQKGVTDVDYVFDVPVSFFESLTGIHYAKNISCDSETPWQVLRRQ